MKRKLEEIRDRRGRLHSALEENNTSIDVIIDAMYADSETHFIWELLQNGDDAGATRLKLEANGDTIVLQHDGRPFTIEDIDGISNIGASTKRNNSVTGKFGVGFKSVFSFCDSVELYNGEIAIELTGKLYFEILDTDKRVPSDRTRFVFKGVNDPEGLVADVYAELKGREDAFMYLKSLKRISLCDETFKAKEVLDTFHSIDTENLTYSFKEGIVGNFYCMFPTKNETGLPIHVNATFDVTASRENFRGSSERNDMLMKEYEDNFVNVLHKAKHHITTGNMMEIILRADSKYDLKNEELLKVRDIYYSWNELVKDESEEGIYTKFPYLLQGKVCADIGGLAVLTEKDLPTQVITSDKMVDYFKFMRYVSESEIKREYLQHKIFLDEDRKPYHNTACQFLLLDSTPCDDKVELHKGFEEVSDILTDLQVRNDYRISVVKDKIIKDKYMSDEDIEGWVSTEKKILKAELANEPLFEGKNASEVWVANTLLYILRPDMSFVKESYLTEFMGVVTTIEELTGDELSLKNVVNILTSGDANRMLLMLDYLKSKLATLTFLQNKTTDTLNSKLVTDFFGELFTKYKAVFDVFGNQVKVGDTTRRTIDPEFLEAYQAIAGAPKITEYMSIVGNGEDSIWGYGDEDQETKHTKGLSPKEIGDLGELFVMETLMRDYPDRNILHLNGDSEAGEHYDILLGGVIKVEVKTRKSGFTHAKRGVKLSRLQVQECISTEDNNFWLVIVNLDMQDMKILTKSQMIEVAMDTLSIGPDIFE